MGPHDITLGSVSVNRRRLFGLTGAAGAGILATALGATPAHAASIAWSNPVLGPNPTTYSGHLGWDIPSPARTPVYAAADGTVVGVHNGAKRGDRSNPIIGGRTGNGVRIKHPDGRYSYYGHLTVAAVSNGQVVSRGQYIGSVGNTGNTKGPTGNHLHFEIHWNSSVSGMINAKSFLAARGITLSKSTPVGSTGFPAIKQGASGNTVRVLQRLLRGEGLAVVVDGNFGPVLSGQVKTVQSRKGLWADGLVGNISWAAFTRRLVKGSGGGKVGGLQQALNNHGAKLLIDNDFGSVTVTALKAFQQRKGLVADAICGPLTWSALI